MLHVTVFPRCTSLALLLAAFTLSPALAQQPGNCSIGQARETLDVNNVSSCIANNGMLFGFVCPGTDYEVPKGSGLEAIFVGGLWVGGKAGSETRFAGATYSNYQFWPGPLDNTGRPVNPSDCSEYDRIFKVSQSDIDAYDGGATPAPDLAEWPADLGAPVIDGDGDPTNYDLAAGDRPNLQGGHQTLWWVMNDTGNFKSSSYQSVAIGVEVQMQAWAFSDPSKSHLQNTTFYRATILYKGSSTLDETVASLWIDGDVGNSQDDFFGSDSVRALAYMYNGDVVDENGYGDLPAAIGATILDGFDTANGTDTGAYVATSYYAGAPASQGDPENALEAFEYMNGRWRDASPITFGGDGYDNSATAGPMTRFLYSGTPPSGWSEVATGNPPVERAMVLSSGPVTMTNGDAQTIEFAVAFGRATTAGAGANVQAVTTLLSEVDAIRAFVATADEPGANAPAGLELAVAPNPVANSARLELTIQTPQPVTVNVFDPLGRRVAVLHDGPLTAGAHPFELATSALAPGIYVVRAKTNAGTTSSRLTVAR
ncbi:MAG: hypothetical protein Rubg2KO_08490 [Rubricoccaceae bacterium]